MILEKSPVSSLPYSLHSTPAQAAKLILHLRRLQYTTAVTKACAGKFADRHIRWFFCLIVSEQEVWSLTLKACGEVLAEADAFCLELLKTMGTWQQAGTPARLLRRQLAHVYGITAFYHHAHYIARPTRWPQNAVHFRMDRCKFLTQNLTAHEIGPLSS